MTHPADFQTIIMKLQQFWADQGCMMWQPYYSQVGAGTMNPATFLRVLGPEPWNVAYVEPSVRPDDGRYAENPNRFQLHYQFQVILKPDPGNPQELYLKSLETIGIDPRQHDIRFVEDNWEQPTVSAWGLGWEVWLDGQEITQFTYFQQMGGVNLDPVSVEITYGLERILISLHNANAAWELPWNASLKYGDVRRVEEFEHSKYYFEIGDVERLRQMYALFEAEAKACLEQGLVLPAHDYVLKCSHAFNVLDTRGAIGVTERQVFIRRMRELARRVAETYVEQRQRLEYPWLKDITGGETALDERLVGGVSAPGAAVYPTLPAPLLLEVGVEELPAADLDSALEQLRSRVPVLLNELRLEHGAWRVLGTPRRLVVHIEDLAPQQVDLEQIVKGPPADRAFNADGTPTKTAEGFARSKGVAVSDLQVREMDGGRYCVAVVHQAGRSTSEVMLEALPGLLAGLRFDKTMRWNSTQVAFSRPLRWLLALYGETVIPFRYAGLVAANLTRGLRFRQPEGFVIESIAGYFDLLSGQGIMLDPAERRQVIAAQVAAAAARAGGSVADDAALLGEVTNLVEVPTTLLGSFEQSHLSLPREVLISVMKKHQRYFPVEATNGVLLPYFIAVRNGDDQGLDLVTQGNEHVVRARFADANFFVREDLKKPLEAYLPGLATATFQAQLGSLLDKARRVSALTADLISPTGLSAPEAAVARRAAELCKADLGTQMVVEMTSLQGIMGRYYALHSGETEPVALAIFEHYLPRYAGDASPSARPGLVVGLADRLDTLVGLFAAGLAPTGNKDPFAQRRAALGLVQNLMTWDLDFDLRQAIGTAAVHLPISASPENQAAVLEFIIERLRNVLLEAGGRYDVVEAVLAAQGANPARARRSVLALSQWIARPDWNTILPAFARCVRITRPVSQRYAVVPEQFVDAAEEDLFAALVCAETTLSGSPPGPHTAAAANLSVDELLNAFLPIIPAINTFFDRVLVMSEDPSVRANRLGLLQRITGLAEGVADFSRLEGF